MIIVVCTDDPSLMDLAERASTRQAGVFGTYHRVFADQIASLSATENLFLIAHGAFRGDDNNPVIGDQAAAFYVNAVVLYQALRSLFPRGYTGSVYIDACESATNDASTFSFAEVFKAQVQGDFGNTRVYGRNGKVRGAIPTPSDLGWTQS